MGECFSTLRVCVCVLRPPRRCLSRAPHPRDPETTSAVSQREEEAGQAVAAPTGKRLCTPHTHTTLYSHVILVQHTSLFKLRPISCFANRKKTHQPLLSVLPSFILASFLIRCLLAGFRIAPPPASLMASKVATTPKRRGDCRRRGTEAARGGVGIGRDDRWLSVVTAMQPV